MNAYLCFIHQPKLEIANFPARGEETNLWIYSGNGWLATNKKCSFDTHKTMDIKNSSSAEILNPHQPRSCVTACPRGTGQGRSGHRGAWINIGRNMSFSSSPPQRVVEWVSFLLWTSGSHRSRTCWWALPGHVHSLSSRRYSACGRAGSPKSPQTRMRDFWVALDLRHAL